MAGLGPRSAGGKPLPALGRLSLLTLIFSVFPTPSLRLPVPPPSAAFNESRSILMSKLVFSAPWWGLAAPPSVPTSGVRDGAGD